MTAASVAGDAFVDLRGVSRSYRAGPTSNRVLHDVDLALARGQFAAIYGPSGSGKSTMLRIIGGLDLGYVGRVAIDGTDLKSLTKAALTGFRARKLSFVFQDFRLLEGVNVLTNVAAPLYALGVARDELRQRAETALDLVDLGARGRSLPGDLSGGEQQRIAIARALVAGTDVIICDEPTGNLNRSLAHEIWDLLGTLQRDFGKTLIVATHDEYGAGLADVVLGIDNGVVTRTAA